MSGFSDPSLEAAWQRKWAQEQAAVDLGVSLQTLLFPSLAARTLWHHVQSSVGEGRGTLTVPETLWLIAFLAWAPLFVWLPRQHPAAYRRLRTPLVLLSRLHCQLTLMRWAPMFREDAAEGAGDGSGELLSLEHKLAFLLWKPGSLVAMLCTYMLPVKYNAPCAAVLLAMVLRSTLRQCVAECRGGGVQTRAAGLYADVARVMRGWHKPWTGAAASRAVGACSNASRAGGAAAATAGFCSWHGCRNTCVVVNTWLLMTVGTLLPLLVAWAFEERSRLHFVEGWLGRFMPGGSGSNRGNFDSGTATGGSTTDGGSSSSERRAPQAGWRPVPVLALAAWLLATTWALWMLMDVLLLPV